MKTITVVNLSNEYIAQNNMVLLLILLILKERCYKKRYIMSYYVEMCKRVS